ncbi:MAG TPA: EAL domain-containing protein [Caulobacteraceae bacterium]|nr:EAL domain-containing protein [Caulobacteraceae bacterium]
MQIAPHRLLGFAFAIADLLVEVAPSGKIVFAVGAAGVLAGEGERQLMGRDFAECIDPEDRDLIWALMASAEGGARRGPAIARLATAPGQATRAFSICVCKLPQNEGAISCALNRTAPPKLGRAEGGLFERDEFEEVARNLFETARSTGEQLELSFVEMDGLADAANALPADKRKSLAAKVAGAIRAQSHGGASAAKLDEERYALVRAAGESPEAMTDRLGRLIAQTAAIDGLKLAASSMALNGDASPSQIVRAVRYALDDFIEEGGAAARPASLQDAVNASVERTLKKASALGSAVADRRFKLVFQPVVTIATGQLHHHEVLVRFGEDESPFPMIRMAEELDLIETLDLAVVDGAAAELSRDGKLKLAVNVSGRTITSAAFVERARALVAEDPTLRERLMFELTESATIDDLALADRHIQALRRMGCEVCLDDFGSGAASLAYLQQLSLDLVKIDGRYIRQLQHGGREATFIRHLVQMCAELGVKTVAEMVETAQTEEAVRKAGVDFGQGYLYGMPTERPLPPASRAGPVAARRVGAVETWG